MKRRPTITPPREMRPPMRHVWRHQVSDEADLLFQVRGLADQGDRVNLLRVDRRRFTVVQNGDRYMVRDGQDAPIATHDTVRECIAAGDAHLDAVEEARAQHEADFGGDDPGSAA